MLEDIQGEYITLTYFADVYNWQPPTSLPRNPGPATDIFQIEALHCIVPVIQMAREAEV